MSKCLPPDNKNALNRRRRVMNDDVLKQVLSYLTLKEKIKAERVSKQFLYCSRQLLFYETTLTIGDNIIDRYQCNEKNTSHSSRKYNNSGKSINHFGPNDRTTLSKVFEKCPNIKCLELLNCKLEAKTFEWFAERCPQLECMRIGDANYLTDADWEYVGQVYGDRLLHLYIYSNRISELGLNGLIRNLPKLQELTVKHFHKDFRLIFAQCLSKSLKTLQLMDCTNIDINELICLNSGVGKSLRKLTISSGPLFSNFNEKFSFICNNFQQLSYLSFLCNSSELYLRDLDNLTKLRHLKIQYFENNFLDFSSLSLINTMENLRTLYIECAYFSPKMLDTIEKKFPRVRKLTLIACNFCCGCNVNDFMFDNCIICYENCWQSIAKLPRLQCLHIKFYSFHITEPLLKLLPNFKTLRTVEFPTYRHITYQIIELLVESCIVLANRNRKQWITLKTHRELSQVISLILTTKMRPRNLVLLNIV